MYAAQHMDGNGAPVCGEFPHIYLLWNLQEGCGRANGFCYRNRTLKETVTGDKMGWSVRSAVAYSLTQTHTVCGC